MNQIKIIKPLYIAMQFTTVGISLMGAVFITEKVSPILGVIMGLMFMICGLLGNRLLIECCFSVVILRDVFTEDLPEDYIDQKYDQENIKQSKKDQTQSKIYKSEASVNKSGINKSNNDESSNLLR